MTNIKELKERFPKLCFQTINANIVFDNITNYKNARYEICPNETVFIRTLEGQTTFQNYNNPYGSFITPLFWELSIQDALQWITKNVDSQKWNFGVIMFRAYKTGNIYQCGAYLRQRAGFQITWDCDMCGKEQIYLTENHNCYD